MMESGSDQRDADKMESGSEFVSDQKDKQRGYNRTGSRQATLVKKMFWYNKMLPSYEGS